MFKRLSDWWAGKIVQIPDDPANGIYVMPYIERPAAALAYEKLKNFCSVHWQFLIGTAIGVAGLVLAYLALK